MVELKVVSLNRKFLMFFDFFVGFEAANNRFKSFENFEAINLSLLENKCARAHGLTRLMRVNNYGEIMEQIYIEKKSKPLSAEEIAEIEEFYGGQSIEDLRENYQMSDSELLSAMKKNKSDDERARLLEIENQRRAAELEKEQTAEAEERRERFENILRHRFFEANREIGASENDFERLKSKLYDDELLENYRRSVAADEAEHRRTSEKFIS